MTDISAKRLVDGISAEIPDWSRETKTFLEWAPPRSLIASIRSYQRHEGRRGLLAAIGRLVATQRHRFWSIVTGADIPINCRIAGGLMIPHPHGIVIHSEAVIGPNCLIMQNATIGARTQLAWPKIGGHVDIGPGAAVLGGITIGDHAQVGPLAMVIRDVPAGGVALAPLAEIRGPA